MQLGCTLCAGEERTVDVYKKKEDIVDSCSRDSMLSYRFVWSCDLSP